MPDRNEEPLSKIDPSLRGTTDAAQHHRLLRESDWVLAAIGSGDGKAIACGR